MTIKIVYDVKEPQFDRKIRNDGNLLLPLYINWSITKKFLIETFLKMIDSSIKNLGKLEYDEQNCLQIQKIPIRPLVVNRVIVWKIHSTHLQRNIATSPPTLMYQ